MRKIPFVLGYILISVILPLIGKPSLMISVQTIVMAIAIIVIMATQPPVELSKAKEKKNTDRSSVIHIAIASLIGIIAPLIEWAYFKNAQVSTLMTWIGIAIIVGGIAFRVLSIRYLGKFFTTAVETQSGQNIITEGPYTIVRHPSYLGALMAFIGLGIFLNAPVGTIIALIAMMLAYYNRITAEESTMVKEIGEAYKAFQKKTPYRLIPWIW